jgi:hypothetical protein
LKPIDDGEAVQVLEARAQRDELQEIGNHFDVDALAARDLDQIEQLRVLLERQRDVEVIDLLALRDLADFGQGPEQR